MSSFNTQKRLHVRQLGRQPYEPVFRAMRYYTDHRNEDSRDEFWLVSHDPVFTQGQAGKSEHILFAGDIPVVQVDRGGQVTYHGPGQIVGYPMLDIDRKGVSVRALVTAIEQSLIRTLAEFDIEAKALSNAPGVYVDAAKIASLGLRIRNGKSYHGLALNVDMDMEPFKRINPCGYAGLEMTQVSSQLPEDQMPGYSEIEERLLDNLVGCLGYTGWSYVENPDSVIANAGGESEK